MMASPSVRRFYQLFAPLNAMSHCSLPENWVAGEIVPEYQIYSSPPESSDTSKINILGYRDCDNAYRIYSVPVDTPVGEVVRVFQVGSRYADTDGIPVDEMIRQVAERAEKIAALVPCHVVFADAAGLKIKFARQITRNELEQIEALFPIEDAFVAGLERYLSEARAEGALLDRLLTENAIEFWWD